VPAATEAFVTTTSESDCNRVNSKFAAELGENTETDVPLAVVSLIPVIGRVKLTTVVFLGGVSEMETLSIALPPPQLVVHLFFVPLQEERDRIAENTIKTRYFLEFIQTPHDGFGRHLWRRCAAGIPPQHFNPVYSPGCTEN
jgi:hypothetical protein